MYIATFYSYKGGVGRTLALANVATHLVRRGRRVLLVDFDLEAPGLDTFALFRARTPTRGIVEYVSDYLAFHETPDVSHYSYPVTLPDRISEEAARSAIADGTLTLSKDGHVDEPPNTGRLWIMPAGRRDQSYSRLLQNIDWGALYAEHNGYLMFEDLKEQWKETLNPDYVLIDSRTGHTDIGGICTRHLPDAVVLLFFPNDQNLFGLDGVVRDIRDEAKPPRKKDITLHFVESNVPDLDDEDRILRNRRVEFQRRLNFKQAPLIIHHYNSLSLLNQAIFCEDRQRSRLAAEYRQLANAIIRRNSEDKEGAMMILRGYADERRRGNLSPSEGEDLLKKIQKQHENDGDILTQLASLRMDEGSHTEATRVLGRALKMEVASPRILVLRAQCRLFLRKDEQGAKDDALEALTQSTISEPDAFRAFDLLAKLSQKQTFREAAALPIVDRLTSAARLFICRMLNRDILDLPISARILKGVLNDPGAEEPRRADATNQLALSLIGMGAFSDAIDLLEQAHETDSDEILYAFNYAMARWALDGKCTRALFQKVVDLNSYTPESSPGANYAQCMAIAHWAIGNSELADQFLERADSIANDWAFSCWRYLEVSKETFCQDVQSIKRMFSGEAIVPEFFARKQSLSLREGLLDS